MTATPAPGVVWGSYPERDEAAPLGNWRLGTLVYRRQADAACHAAPRWRALAPAAFDAELERLRAHLAKDGLTDRKSVV